MSPKIRRGRHPLPDVERKDRVVQARVAEELDEALRKEAKRKRVTVSQLIRNVLEETFHLVDDIVAGTAHITHAVTRDARRIAASAKGEPLERPRLSGGEHPRPPRGDRGDRTRGDRGDRTRGDRGARGSWSDASSTEGIYAWQEVVINQNTTCSRCGAPIDRGSRGFVGLQTEGGPGIVCLCPSCAARL